METVEKQEAVKPEPLLNHTEADPRLTGLRGAREIDGREG